MNAERSRRRQLQGGVGTCPQPSKLGTTSAGGPSEFSDPRFLPLSASVHSPHACGE